MKRVPTKFRRILESGGGQDPLPWVVRKPGLEEFNAILRSSRAVGGYVAVVVEVLLTFKSQNRLSGPACGSELAKVFYEHDVGFG